jgi:uncharacterized protein YjiS (DUF1127 family)
MSTTVSIAAVQSARHHAQRQLLDQIEHAVKSFAERLRQRREAIATREQIAALDAATLRDLGMHRSEAGSIAAEAHGLALATRQRILDARQDSRFV